MKRLSKFSVLSLCVLLMAALVFTGCQTGGGAHGSGNSGSTGNSSSNPIVDPIDYASQVKLDFDSETLKQEVKVKIYVDGDTTHFDPINTGLTPTHDFSKTYNYIKARYLAVNTPESTGDIEKWGKSASDFTHEKLAGASSIVVESDDANWNIDSTGERYLLWIWYKPAGEADYRNLNIELLQEGFGRYSSTTDNRYGDVAFSALEQAQALQLHVYSPDSTVDPNYFDGEAAHIDIKTLRFFVEDYVNKPVRVEGVVTAKFGNTAYIQQYDEETGLTYGFACYYGFHMGEILNILTPGNTVSVRGKVTAYNGTYQISDVNHNEFRPTLETNTILIEAGEENAPLPFNPIEPKYITSTETISGRFEKHVDGEDIMVDGSIARRDANISTAVSLENLECTTVYTTSQGQSAGAMTLTCTGTNSDGSTTTVTIRTEVLTEDGALVTAVRYKGKRINVKGIVDVFLGVDGTSTPSYQVRVHDPKNIVVLSAAA